MSQVFLNFIETWAFKYFSIKNSAPRARNIWVTVYRSAAACPVLEMPILEDTAIFHQKENCR